jgi:glycosyltransferase involved in cell wall biosynthesis
MKLISIITINFNNVKGLKKTLDSLSSQTFKDFEHIVIDGASTDGSVELIKNYSHITYWISEKDNGIYDAMNKGVKVSKGKYLLFLNSGDVLSDTNVIESVASNFKSDKSIYYGDLLLEKNNSIEKHQAPASIDLDFMLNSTFWHPCTFVKSDLFKNLGLYNTEFKICGDYEFFVRCFLNSKTTYQYLNINIALFDGNGISNDVSKQELQAKERDLAWELNISDVLFSALKSYNRFNRSSYKSVFNFIQSLRGKQKF